MASRRNARRFAAGESCCLLPSAGLGRGVVGGGWWVVGEWVCGLGTGSRSHGRMQKVEWEHRVPSPALQLSGISRNDAKCQSLSLLLKFLRWAEQPLMSPAQTELGNLTAGRLFTTTCAWLMVVLLPILEDCWHVSQKENKENALSGFSM